MNRRAKVRIVLFWAVAFFLIRSSHGEANEVCGVFCPDLDPPSVELYMSLHQVLLNTINARVGQQRAGDLVIVPPYPISITEWETDHYKVAFELPFLKSYQSFSGEQIFGGSAKGEIACSINTAYEWQCQVEGVSVDMNDQGKEYAFFVETSLSTRTALCGASPKDIRSVSYQDWWTCVNTEKVQREMGLSAFQVARQRCSSLFGSEMFVWSSCMTAFQRELLAQMEIRLTKIVEQTARVEIERVTREYL